MAMCGRFTLIAETTELEKCYKAKFLSPWFSSDMNIAPGSLIPIIAANNPFAIEPAIWGIKPIWWTHGARALINIRTESLKEKKTFAKNLKSGRCLIPATGFYEWKTEGKKKTPILYALKLENIFSFAGLIETGESGITCAILTTVANPLVSKVHDRMPVILKKADEKYWMDESTDPLNILDILEPYPASKMRAGKADI